MMVSVIITRKKQEHKAHKSKHTQKKRLDRDINKGL